MVVSTYGDFGDIIYLSAVLQDCPGGPHTVLLIDGVTGINCRESLLHRKHIVIPLVETFPYVRDVRPIRAGDHVDWDSGTFRVPAHNPFYLNLVRSHASHARAITGYPVHSDGRKQWINVKASTLSRDRVIVNRTARYHNPYFPWKEIVQKYRRQILFIGQQPEWQAFVMAFGMVAYQPTADLLEAAELIAGCRLFIGNQSCAYAIAEGLKVQAIQEVCLECPNCIFKRPGVQYVYTGACNLPDLDSRKYVTLLPKETPPIPAPPPRRTNRILMALSGAPQIHQANKWSLTQLTLSYEGLA